MSTNSKAEGCENNEENVEVAEQPERPETPDMQCSICLDEITNVCKTDMCRHSFCYKCLIRWSTIESFCPLCKTHFKSIRHSFTEDGLYQIYDVPERSSNIPASEPTDPFFHMIIRGVLYHQSMWAEPLSDLNGSFRGVSSRFFRENPEETLRLREFIRREVFVLMILQSIETDGQLNTLHTLIRNREFVTDSIISWISVYEIMGGEIADMLQPYVGRYALQFCHELHNFANSPYDNLVDYNHNASYSGGIVDLPVSEQLDILYQIQNATRILSNVETIVSGSDNEENIETDARRSPPEVTVLDFSNEESDLEIAGIMSRPIETHESPFAGQPSTSTGIRHSVERPDNTSNPTTQRFSIGGTRIVDYSSSDEESTSDVQAVSRMVCGKRKRQVETNKNKRMKKSTIVGRQSYSESSSSDDEDV